MATTAREGKWPPHCQGSGTQGGPRMANAPKPTSTPELPEEMVVVGNIFWDQCWAHTRPSAANVGTSAGPMQDHRQHILRPVLGPFKIIGSIFWDQCWAHASPAAASLVPVLGPYKSISSTYFRWCWAHSRHSIISSGPTLIFHNACLLCQWAHPKALVVGYDGPILKIHSHCLHGPMWAFPIYSVLLQMGFDKNIVTFLCHYVQWQWLPE